MDPSYTFTAHYRKNDRDIRGVNDYDKYMEIDIKGGFITLRLCEFPAYYMDEYEFVHANTNPRYDFISEGRAFRIGTSNDALVLMGSAIFILGFGKNDVNLTIVAPKESFSGYSGHYKIWKNEYDINDAYYCPD